MSEEFVLRGDVLPNEQLTLFELAEIANREHALALRSGLNMLEHAGRAGDALTRAKSLVKHGQWLPWLKDNFDGSERTAQGYMQIAANPQYIADFKELGLRKALDAISTGDDVDSILSSTTYECYTPAEYVEAAREVLGAIDLDPASSTEANETIKAAQIYTLEDDGLAHEWHGRIWLNPPYGRKLTSEFVAKAVDEYNAGRVTAAILLLNAYGFDASWFQPLWDGVLCFTDHRIKFYGGGPTFGSLFVYLGPQREEFARVFGGFGAVVEEVAA